MHQAFMEAPKELHSSMILEGQTGGKADNQTINQQMMW